MKVISRKPSSLIDSLPRTPIATKKGTVAVVGLGYVGLPLLLLSEAKGFKAIGVDTDRAKIDALKNGQAPEITKTEMARLRGNKIKLSTSAGILKEADIVVVCVPTPVHEDHKPDLRPLKSATLSVAKYLQPGTLVVIESTVNPGVCEEVLIPLLERVSGLTAEKDFYFAHCPERINPGDREFTVANIPRVIGSSTKESGDRAEGFYRAILDVSMLTRVSLKEAESVKMVENAFRDVNIAFVNELAMSFDKLGIDLTHVIRAASTKPFGFMPHYPGCGVGGHCIPVDPYYLIDYARKNGFSHKFIKTARAINNQMPAYTIKRLKAALNTVGKELKGTKVALLGLSYKRDVADCRESPAMVIREKLRQAGASVIAFDPLYTDENTYSTLEETLKEAKVVVIATDHTLFRQLKPETLEEHNISILIDGRNCLSKKTFAGSSVIYRGIGR